MKFPLSLGALALLFSVSATARAADVGVLALAQNEVRVQAPGGKAKRAGAMQSLPDGARVQVGPNSRAVLVLYKNGARFSLPAGCVAKITASGLEIEGAVKASALPSLKIEQARLLRGSRIAYGRAANTVVRSGDIEILTLAFGATLSDRPTFRWKPIDGVESYLLQLWDENDKPVLRRELKGDSFSWPAELPALRPEADYLWRISAISDDKPGKREGTFRVLAPEVALEAQGEIKAVTGEAKAGGEGDDETETLDAVLRAEIYRKYDLLDDAAAIYETLLAKNPNSIALRASYAEILTSQNRLQAAKEQRDAAEKLSLE